MDLLLSLGHELLLEVIPPSDLPQDAQTIVRALKRLYNIGVHPEWWKLAPMPAATWSALDGLVAERDPYCRGVVIPASTRASRSWPRASARRPRRAAAGFVVGRTIFQDPSREWLAGRIDDEGLVAGIRSNFEALIRVWREARGTRKEAA